MPLKVSDEFRERLLAFWREHLGRPSYMALMIEVDDDKPPVFTPRQPFHSLIHPGNDDTGMIFDVEGELSFVAPASGRAWLVVYPREDTPDNEWTLRFPPDKERLTKDIDTVQLQGRIKA
jgi:hypothetical protein